MESTRCIIEGCDKPRYRKYRMCAMHRARVDRHGDPHYVTSRKTDPVARFWSKVERRSDGECWPWRGTLVNGYGQFKVDGRGVPAHRYAYELEVGPIPEGLHLDHVRARGCIMTNCVNPAHLEPVTPQENVRRSGAPSTLNARKTHCPRGHEYDRVKVRTNGRLFRACKKCAADAERRRRAARAAAL